MQSLFLVSLTDIGNSIVAFFSGLGIWYHLLYNFIGAIGLIVKIIGFQLKSRSKRIVFNAIQGICWATYFLLTGNATAGLTAPLGLIQSYVFYQRGKKKWADSYFWIILFVVIQLAMAVWNVSDGISMHDIFPIIAGPFGLVSYFVINPKLFRSLMFITSLCWFANSLIGTFFSNGGVNLWMAFICDVLSVGSIIIAILRFDVLKKVRDDEVQVKTE